MSNQRAYTPKILPGCVPAGSSAVLEVCGDADGYQGREREDGSGGASLDTRSLHHGCSSGTSLGALWPGVLRKLQSSCSSSCPRTGRSCVFQVQSHPTCRACAFLWPCLPFLPLESTAGMVGKMLRHPSSLGNPPSSSVSSSTAACSEGLEPVSTIFPSCGVCQPHASPCSLHSISLLAHRAPQPHMPGTVQVPQLQSDHLPACLALVPCFGTSGLWREQGSHPTVLGCWSAGAQSLGIWAGDGHATPALSAGACLARSWQG